MAGSASIATVIYGDPHRESHRSAPWRPASAGLISGCMLVSWIVLLIAVAGLLLYVLTTNPKLQEIGKITFFCGLLVTCFLLGGKSAHIP
jgi:hypothetical protein